MSASCTTKPTTSSISSRSRMLWRRLAAVAAVTLAPALASAQILDVEESSLTSYLAGATNVQDLRPQAMQRAVHIDGSGRVGDFFGAVAPGHAGSDGGYNRNRTLSGQLDLAMGTVTITDVDMALPAEPGGGWVVGRTYNARQHDSGHHVSSGPMGNNWATSIPEIVLYEGATDADDVLYLVAGADRYVEFKRIGTGEDEFKGVNGATGVFQHQEGATNEPDTYTLYLPDGTQIVFFGFDGDADPAEGQFWKKIDPSGNTVFVGDETTGSTARTNGYDSGGRVTTVYDETDNDGRRYTYTYNGSGKLTKVEAEIKSGGTYSVTVGTVEYDYYGAAESYGSEHDLKLVTITTPMHGDADLIQKKHYRYWKGTYNAGSEPPNLGQAGALKYIMEFEGYRQADWDGTEFDDSPLSMAEVDLKSFAAAYFEYDASQRITRVWFNGECGCSGGTDGVHDITYGTSGTIGGSYDSAWKLRAVVSRPDGTYVTSYFDEVGQVLGRATTAGNPASSPGDTWATTVVRDSDGRITELSTPANVSGYNHSTGAFTRSTTEGLIHVYSRQSSGSLDGFVEHYEHQESADAMATAYLDRTIAYTTRSLTVGNATLVSPFVNSVKSVHVEGKTTGTVAAADYDETTMSFDWHSATATDVLFLRPKTITTTYPKVSTGKNGKGSGGGDPAVTEIQYLRQDGTPAFHQHAAYTNAAAADLRHDYTYFNDGQLVRQIADVTTNSTTGTGDDEIDPADDPSTAFGITETGSGEHIATAYTYDDQGRPDQTISFAQSATKKRTAEKTYFVFPDRRIAILSFPRLGSYPGPASYSVSNHAGNIEDCMIWVSDEPVTEDPSGWGGTVATDTLVYDPLLILQGSVARWTRSRYDTVGTQLKTRRVYHDIPDSGEGGSTDYDEWQYSYDGMGRLAKITDPTGTITRTNYDTLGRVASTDVGTNDTGSGSDDMVTVSEIEYDGGSAGGNSYVTAQTAFVEDGTTGQRVTEFINDYRGRTIVTKSPQAPHTVAKYDNLGRVLAVGMYSSSSGLDVSTDPTATTSTNRMALSETFYDERGQVWKTVQWKIDQDDGSKDDSLESLTWYDGEGKAVKMEGDQLIKMEYDRLHRSVRQYILASDNDSGYADALTVAGDIVLEESQSYFDADNGDLLMSVSLSRPHDEYGGGEHTGALDTDSDLSLVDASELKGRAQITAMWYDDLGRVVKTASYGDNGGSDFDRDTESEPTVLGSPDILVITRSYDLGDVATYGAAGEDDGAVKEMVDVRGKKTRFEYDDAGRLTLTISNYENGSLSNPDRVNDIYTRYVYENGLQTQLWADIDGDPGSTVGDQVTTYFYGVSKGASAGDSAISHGGLLQRVQYPKQDGSQPDPDREVSYAYNAQGEVIWTKDQAGNVIETDYDTGARIAARKATTIVTGFDDAIQGIGMAYDGLGRVATVSQYDGTNFGTAAITDEVGYTYDDWGPISQFEQDVNSAINGDAFSVGFTYAKATGGRNTVRRSTMNLGTRYISYGYDSTGGLHDNNASRVSRVSTHIGANGAQVVTASYDYLGLGTLVGTTYPEPGVFSRRYTTSTGAYDHLDRFNRITTDLWTKDLATDIDFYDVDIAWDEGSNITSTVDNILTASAGGSGNGLFDVGYEIDALNRVVQASRGNWTGSGINNLQFDQSWDLSQTGNWLKHLLDLDGDGNYTGTGELADEGTFNAVNELRERDIDSSGGTDYTLDYDKPGNLIDDGKDYEYEYDVWGRLRKVTNRSTSALVAEYWYNGLNHRIGWHSDVTDGAGGGPDGTVDADDPRYFFVYDDQWRVIATYRKEDGQAIDASPKEWFVYHAAGLDGYGGSSYIDATVLRDRDYNTAWHAASDGTLEQRRYYCQNWRADVVVILSEAGVQDERVAYSAYGVPFGMPAGDTDADGDFDTNDQGAIAFWEMMSTYDVRGDVNLDGSVTSADSAAATTESLGWEALSGIDSRKGYAGYEHAPELTGTSYHVRYRVLKADLGRWLTRDPLGYVDGVNQYDYVSSRPIIALDPTGEQAQPLPDPGPYLPSLPIRHPGDPSSPFPFPQPATDPALVPGIDPGCVVLCIVVGRACYEIGEDLSPRFFPPIEPLPRYRPPPNRPPKRNDCKREQAAKDAACGALPKGNRPAIPAPPQSPPPGIPPTGPRGPSKKVCEQFYDRIMNRMRCLNARVNLKACMDRKGIRDPKEKKHKEIMDDIRKDLQDMNRDYNKYCKKKMKKPWWERVPLPTGGAGGIAGD